MPKPNLESVQIEISAGWQGRSRNNDMAMTGATKITSQALRFWAYHSDLINGVPTVEKSRIKSVASAGERNHPQLEHISTFGLFLSLIYNNRKLLVLGPVIAAMIAFAIASTLPKSYTSLAYLALDEEEARGADMLMRSTLVLDKVLAQFPQIVKTPESGRGFLEQNRRLIAAPGMSPKISAAPSTRAKTSLFRLEYSDRNPALAQQINSAFIEVWLESTRPPPDRRAIIEAEIEHADLQATSISRLIERLEKDAPSLVAQGSLQGELATPILGLISKRDQQLMNLITLRNSLKGVSRDVIFAAPDLPQVPSWPQRGIIAILSSFAASLLLLIWIILRGFRTQTD